jgi:hypothetical protein
LGFTWAGKAEYYVAESTYFTITKSIFTAVFLHLYENLLHDLSFAYDDCDFILIVSTLKTGYSVSGLFALKEKMNTSVSP